MVDVPRLYDRDRPLWWDLLALIPLDTRYRPGNEWYVAADGGILYCESCDEPRGMIVRDPFIPESNVDIDTDNPKQVLCKECCIETLPEDSPYRA